MDANVSFGLWLQKRRKAFDLTREELAQRVGCSASALRKIETDVRRPSKQLAELLAATLEIPIEERVAFIRIARGELFLERMKSPLPSPDLSHSVEPRAGLLQPSQTFSPLIPIPPTPFIGREPELLALGQLLRDPQCLLLTIVGPGGIGKTRLAIEAANQYKDSFPDGVWFIPLAALNSPALLVPAIAGAVNFRLQDPTDPQTQLLRYLYTKKLLLILDNAEHLLDGVGLFTEILNACPQVKLLVTSRERINLLSEWVFDVQGLPVPASDQEEQFASYSAVALFVQSAGRVRVGFELREEDRRCVLKICQILEGMPLGIELAAAWIELLSCEEIEKEIEHNIDFLSVSMRDLPERHRSIRAVFDHSWKMLTVDEQQAMCQLSVFRGGFTREAAEQVAGTSLSTLSTLMNRTLLRRVELGRYDLHDLIRQYSASHMAADPQAHAAAQQRHCACFLALAVTAERELKGSNQLEWLNRLEQELANLRAAWEWALKSNAEAQGMDEPALRLSGALRWFWRMRGHFHEGRDWLMQALQTCPERPTTARASALLGLSMIMNILGDLSAARPQAEESAAIFRKLGNQRGLAEALSEAGATLTWQGEAGMAFARFEEALALYRQAGDRWGEAQVLYRLGGTLVDYSCDSMGRGMLEESAKILADLGEKYLYVYVLIFLGDTNATLGNYTSARTYLEKGLAVATEIKHTGGITDALTSLGSVSRIQGEYLTAQSRFEAAFRVYQEHGSNVWDTGVLCALAENEIAQGNLCAARLHILAASNRIKLSENQLANYHVCYFQGLLAYYEEDAEGAAELFEEVLVLARQGIYKVEVARSAIALARVRRTLGQIGQATELILEALDMFNKYGYKLGITISLEELAAVYAVQQDGARAVMLLSVAQASRERMGAPLPPVDRAAHDSVLATCRAQLGDAVFACAWAEGKAVSLEQAIDFALDR